MAEAVDFDIFWHCPQHGALVGFGIFEDDQVAAGRWILQNGRLVMAVTAPWNVPSARTLRSVGLRYVMADMRTSTDRFLVPPQPLGQPCPGLELYNHYPSWAMNEHIRPKK